MASFLSLKQVCEIDKIIHFFKPSLALGNSVAVISFNGVEGTVIINTLDYPGVVSALTSAFADKPHAGFDDIHKFTF